MYARVSTAEVQSGKMDEVLSISRDSVLPAAKEQQGFKGGLWLTDPDTNKVMILTLWESREDMEAGEQSGYYREQVGKFGGFWWGRSFGKPTRSASRRSNFRFRARFVGVYTPAILCRVPYFWCKAAGLRGELGESSM